MWSHMPSLPSGVQSMNIDFDANIKFYFYFDCMVSWIELAISWSFERFFFYFARNPQTKPQWDRETSPRQNEHVHNRIIGDGADVSRDVSQIGQIDRVADGRSTLENDPWCGTFVHGRPLQTHIPVRSRIQNAHSAGGRGIPVCGRLRSRSYFVCVWISVAIAELFAGTWISLQIEFD